MARNSGLIPYESYSATRGRDMGNHLYYGDNLDILRNEIPDESVDLIYLDPPFNSKATYNILFRSPTGEQSESQLEAFEDTWHWTDEAERAFDEVMQCGNTDVADVLRAMRSFLNENDMMAYLTMMAVRLLELQRVLKPTGSIFLHCDPTASHYLKILMDAIFGARQFRNEIVWHYRRWTGKSKSFQKLHDTIFFYSKTKEYKFNPLFIPYTEGSTSRKEQGVLRRFKKGETPYLVSDGSVSEDGVRDNDVWQIPFVAPSAKERLGYPTQKPLALLEKIILCGSDKGDVVLDPFCGCGTTVHGAEKLERNWIGIDVTHLAVSLIERRLQDAFPKIQYEVHGTPKSIDAAYDLADRDKFQFECWAVSLVGAQPYKSQKRGADRGIDGIVYFKSSGGKTEKAIVSVKGGKNVGVSMVRDLKAVVERENAKMGIFVTLTPPTGQMGKEALSAGMYESGFGKHQKIQIKTVEELLAGHGPDIPLVTSEAFKKAEKEYGQDKQEPLL